MKIVTTSWDDGYKESKAIADLLREYNLKGTFFIPINPILGKEYENMGPEELFLTENDVRGLNEQFEIGAHGVTHSFLTEIPEEETENEIEESKNVLEEIIGEEIFGFAYPAGKFDDQTVALVKKHGYRYARSVGNGRLDFKDRYRVPVTLFCYNNAVRRIKFSLLAPFSKVYVLGGDWAKSVLKAFKNVKKFGGILHIAEHPSRIRNLNYKRKLDEVFSKISGHPEVEYLSNKEMVEKVMSG